MKTQKAANKKSRILQAAAKVLAQKGYSLTTLADVGAEAGTFAGSLYYYFPSKESIVEEVLNIGTTSVSSLVMARVQALPKGVSAYDRIRIALETHLQQMLAKDDFVLAYWKIIDQVPEEIRAKHLVLPREYGHFWQSMLEEAQAAGEIRPDMNASLMRLLIIGSTIYALQWFDPQGQNSPKEIADLLAEMFFLGIVPRGLSFANNGVFADLSRYDQPSLTSADREDDPAGDVVGEAEIAEQKATSKGAAGNASSTANQALAPDRTARRTRGATSAKISAGKVAALPKAPRGGNEAEAQVNIAVIARRTEPVDRRSSTKQPVSANATNERKATSKAQTARSGRGNAKNGKADGEAKF